MKRILKRIFTLMLIAIVICIVVIFACNYAVNKYSQSRCYDNVENVPYNKVGLLLGTSPKLSNGQENLYFKYRIEAAVKLYNAKKIKYILISGDNRQKYYNEPDAMKRALIAQGVPDTAIFLDLAGLRTLDSVLRAKLIFGQNEFTVISQKFHNQRAVYLAVKNNINAVGFNANDVNVYYGFKTRVREYLARVKVFVDLLTNKQPKHLGEKINIP